MMRKFEVLTESPTANRWSASAECYALKKETPLKRCFS